MIDFEISGNLTIVRRNIFSIFSEYLGGVWDFNVSKTNNLIKMFFVGLIKTQVRLLDQTSNVLH